MKRISLLAFCLVVSACGSSESDVECHDNGQCGDMQICTKDKTCKEVECLSNTDCHMNQYCDTLEGSRTYACLDGCTENADCFAGENCDTTTHACTTYGCRSTALDCLPGEYCDTTTGVCSRAEGDWCKTCTSLGTQCGRNAECGMTDLTTGYCYTKCDDTQAEPCPRGFECGQLFQGVTQTYCYGDCEFLTKNGYL